MDICSLSNDVCIGLLRLLLLLCCLALLRLLTTILPGYNQLFIAIRIRDKSAVADMFGIGVCPFRTLLLAVGVAVWAIGVETGCVAAHDV